MKPMSARLHVLLALVVLGIARATLYPSGSASLPEGSSSGPLLDGTLPVTPGAQGALLNVNGDTHSDVLLLGGAQLCGSNAQGVSLYVSSASGQYSEQAAVYLPGLTSIAVTYAPIAVADYDQNGLDDFFVGTDSQLYLYRAGNGSGSYTRVQPLPNDPVGVDYNTGTFLDYNGDGRPDLFVYTSVTYRLYRSESNGSVSDVTSATIPATPAWDGQAQVAVHAYRATNSSAAELIVASAAFVHHLPNLGNGSFGAVRPLLSGGGVRYAALCSGFFSGSATARDLFFSGEDPALSAGRAYFYRRFPSNGSFALHPSSASALVTPVRRGACLGLNGFLQGTDQLYVSGAHSLNLTTRFALYSWSAANARLEEPFSLSAQPGYINGFLSPGAYQGKPAMLVGGLQAQAVKPAFLELSAFPTATLRVFDSGGFDANQVSSELIVSRFEGRTVYAPMAGAHAMLFDMNGDAVVDLVYSGMIGQTAVADVLLGNSTGSFSSSYNFFSVPQATVLPFAFDLTRTPDNKIAALMWDRYHAISTESSQVRAFLGNAAPALGPDIPDACGAWVDLDGSASTMEAMVLGNSYGRLLEFVPSTPALVAIGSVNITVRYCALSVADFNGDSRADVAVCGGDTLRQCYVLRNHGNRTLSVTTLPGSAVTRGAVAWADADGDGLLDVIFAGATVTFSGMAGVYRQYSNGSFLPMANAFDNATYYDLQMYPTLLAADWDGDGRTDLLLAGGASHLKTSFAHLYLATASTASPTRWVRDVNGSMLPNDAIGPLFGSAAAADVDGDLKLDLVLLGAYKGCMNALYRQVNPSSLSSTSASSIGTPSSSTSSSSLSGGDSSSSSSSEDALAGVLGGVFGGTGAFVLLVAACLVCCLCCLCLCVVLLLVLVLAVLMVLAVAVVGVGGVAVAGGAGWAVFKVRGPGGGRAGRGREFGDDEADWIVPMDQLLAMVQETESFTTIPFAEIELGQKIGEGAYGAVYLGTWRAQEVAVKLLSAQLDEAALREFRHEALMMAKCSHHPNIVTFLGAILSPEKVGLVTAFCRRGALDSMLRKGELGWLAKLRICRDAAAGLGFLHHLGIVHRDVAARNVLLGPHDHAFLSDFGMSRIVDEAASVDEGNVTKSTVGPVRWMAPEAMTERRYSAATDAFSFGVLLWEVATDGELPYSELASFSDVIVAVVRQGERPKIPRNCPRGLASIMVNLWHSDPALRPSLNDVNLSLRALIDEEERAAAESEPSEVSFEGSVSSASSKYSLAASSVMLPELPDQPNAGEEYINADLAQNLGKGYAVIDL